MDPRQGVGEQGSSLTCDRHRDPAGQVGADPARSRARGADFRLNVDLLNFSQYTEVSDRTTGQTQTIRARYLIAADEATSPIREQLGIPRHGVGHLRMLRSVLFRCPEADEALRDVRFYSLLPESGQAEIHPTQSCERSSALPISGHWSAIRQSWLGVVNGPRPGASNQTPCYAPSFTVDVV
ncbi:FAD-dependent monooxygenase [Methylobacterium sp. J-076]|uniref:FAD-dependent monooxygenase n=1 Tax=Methylobacterium sp. J-076 TaxID=2836655 RepID=UPI003919BEE9